MAVMNVMFRVPFQEALGEIKLPGCKIWTFYQDVSLCH